MIPPAELKALEEAVAALEEHNERRFCAHCGTELAASDETEGRVCLCLCSPSDLPINGPRLAAHAVEHSRSSSLRALFKSGKQVTQRN